ncbi:MAG: PEP/pyruvate-binding domain-containing protein, partial [Candidatus Dormibacteria bacterium]
MSDQPSIIRFDEYDCPSAELLGGKVTGLVEMTRSGLRVPPGFAVTTAAHSRLLQAPGMRAALERAGSFAADGAACDEMTRDLREAASATVEAQSLCRQIEAAYTVLGEQLGLQDPPVAVRSSGQVEDGAEASFAGQFDTYLWVTGASSVVDHVLRVWAGSLAGHALSYREHRMLGSGFSPMCVAVQLMVEARAAGVMFTLNPLTGDRSQVVIEGSWGLGEAVVRGDVNPDRWSVIKVTGTVTSQELGDKAHEYRFDTLSGGVAALPVDE